VSEAAALVFHPKQAETLRRMEEADNYNRWLVERGTHLIGTRVLDAGAGIGTFSEQIADGRHVVALEPDPAFLPGLRRRFLGRPNVVVVASAIEEFEREPSPELFDTILCFNVLEHIADDEGTLQRFCRLLKPGGTLLLLVPAHPVAYGKVDSVLGHERRYGKPALAAKLTEAGLEVTKLRHVNPLGLLGWLVTSRVLGASQLPSGALRLFDRHVPILRLLDCLHIPFGLSLWAVARRPV
jgi:SAM-dependent methyltransferase